jgi:hypothetical protein
MAQYAPLTTDDVAAIQAFAKDHGHTWKTTLACTYWYNARVWSGPKGTPYSTEQGSILHGLRNSHGPSWLDGFKLPKAEV